MKDKINKFLTEEDKSTIAEITGYNINTLLAEVKDWSIFNNIKKHVETEYDKFGMHLVRCLLAERILEHKRSLLTDLKFVSDYPEYKKFIKDGVYVWENFNKEDYTRYNNLLRYLTARPNINFSIPSEVRVDENEGYDVQCTLHVDTFFSAFKLFGYLHDISEQHGPFAYVKGSHKNTKNKLKFLYETSCTRSNAVLNENLTRNKNLERWNDSLRLITKNDYCITHSDINQYLKKYGLPPESIITGNKNSIIIADTSGLHRKYPANNGFQRKTSRMSIERVNPFNI